MNILFWNELFHPIQTAKDTLKYGIMSFLLLLDSLVYSLCAWLYQLFVGLSRVQILTEDAYSAIANRIYILVGIVALFIMTFTLLQSMVDPDKVGQNVIKSFKSLVTSILLVILLPTIFKYAFSFQNAIISEGVIHNILDIDISNSSGNSGMISMDEACRVDKQEREQLTDLLMIFYPTGNRDEIRKHVDEVLDGDSSGSAISEINRSKCNGNYIVITLFSAFMQPNSQTGMDELNETVHAVSVFGNFSYIRNMAKDIVDSKKFTYIFLISTAAGLFFAYVILSFCIDLGIRTFKLAFYEIIAPIPIFLRMLPGKDSYFNKWVSATTKCFLEVFVRVLLMEFMIFMCRNFLTLIDMAFDGLSQVALLGKAVLILGLCGFIKQAPKLFSEALGIEGTGVKLNVKEKLKDNVPVVGNALDKAENHLTGAVTGALGAAYTSKMNGGSLRQGLKYGAINGWENGGNQFGKQRKSIYNKAMGFEGTPGWFGGRKYSEYLNDKISDKYKDNYRDNVLPRKVAKKENGDKWQNMYDELLSNIKADGNYTALQQEYRNLENGRSNAVQQIENDRRIANNQFETDKREQIRKLNEDIENVKRAARGMQPGSIDFVEKSNQLKKLQEKLDGVKNTKFDGTAFDSRIKAVDDEIKAAKDKLAYFDEKTEKIKIYNEATGQMEDKLLSEAELKAYKDTRKKYADLDPEYERDLDVHVKRLNEKEDKEWARSAEGRHMALAMQQGFNSSDLGKSAGNNSNGPSNNNGPQSNN